MQRLMRRPSSWGDAERARRPRVDLHLVEVVDAAPAHGRLPVGVLLHPDDGVERLAEQQCRAHVRRTRSTTGSRPR